MTSRGARRLEALLAALGWAALAPAASLAQTPPVFRAGVEAVWLDVFVSSREAPVTGLGAADFEVLDNGVRQQVRVTDLKTMGVTAVLVLDTSESVRGSKLEDLKLACRALLQGLTPRDQAALITFSHEMVLRSPASADRAELGRALALVPAAGATSAFDALYAALKHPWPERPMVLLFTDGADTLSWLRPEDVLQAAKESEALVHVVGSARAGETEHGEEDVIPAPAEVAQRRSLREIAETSGGRFWALPPGGSLKHPFLGILAAMGARYLLSYEPRGVDRTGRHRLQVKVKGRNLDVRHRMELFGSGAGPRAVNPVSGREGASAARRSARGQRGAPRRTRHRFPGSWVCG